MERIEVDTVFGKLSAQVSSDAMYPGIDLCVEQTDGGGKYDKQLALVECTPNHPCEGAHSLRLLVWNSDSEDYTDDFTFFQELPDEEPAEIIWGKYLQYIHKWAESHNGPGFYGMTPTCFHEWRAKIYKAEHLLIDAEPTGHGVYTVRIEQKLEGYVEIEADSKDEALNIAERRYNSDGEELPEMDDFCDLRIHIQE